MRLTRGARFPVLSVLLFVFFLPPSLLGAEAETKVPAPAVSPSPFALTVTNNRVSLKAEGASLTEVVQEFGRQLGVEVKVSGGAEAQVTATFEDLTVEEAMERLKAATGVAYLLAYTQAEKNVEGRIARIELLQQGAGGMAMPPPLGVPVPTEEAALPTPEGADAPFGFEFDPSQYLQPGQ